MLTFLIYEAKVAAALVWWRSRLRRGRARMEPTATVAAVAAVRRGAAVRIVPADAAATAR